MPLAPPRACPCGGRIISGVCSRCGPKARARDTERGHAAARGYDYRWQKFRISYLAQHPLCELDCAERGIVTAATEVHHERKLKDHPELQYDERYLKAGCKSCHSARTARGE